MEPRAAAVGRATGMAKGPSKEHAARIASLDSLRFVCALTVAVAQTGAPPFAPGPESGLFGAVWPASAAVICFFIISGFCIHHSVQGAPGRRPAALFTPGFFIQRYCRIIPPLSVAVLLAGPLGVGLDLLYGPLLWALLAELFYYSVYPALLTLRRRLPSWTPLIFVAFLIGLLVATTNPAAGPYGSFGPALNWLVGLPCWLLGCQLAEAVARRRHAPRIAPATLWGLRLAVWGAFLLCALLRHHVGIGYAWTLNLVAPLATLWIYAEIMSAALRPPPAWLERAGLWSYSLFLTHAITAAWLDAAIGFDPDHLLGWGLRLGVILGAAYLFHLAVEGPTHRLARLLGAGATRWSRERRRPAAS